ncbi:hypothetical protein BXU09_19480 [Deinococcus sp. LM3]|nr:hypothetical protein BXU09_19480 [Deinococcus sp. LM3]
MTAALLYDPRAFDLFLNEELNLQPHVIGALPETPMVRCVVRNCDSLRGILESSANWRARWPAWTRLCRAASI